MSVETQLVTFDEFVALPDPPAGHYELHHGRVVLMPRRKKIHMRVHQGVFDLPYPLLDHMGFLTLEFPCRPTVEYEFRQCGIGWVGWERWESDYGCAAPTPSPQPPASH